jgi:hypothetical protein
MSDKWPPVSAKGFLGVEERIRAGHDEFGPEKGERMFIVMCKVTGGLTGTRVGMLKQDGKVRYFDTEEAAQAEANRLGQLMRNTPNLNATFSYWVEGAGRLTL